MRRDLSGSRQIRMMMPAGTNTTANTANITMGFTTRCKRRPNLNQRMFSGLRRLGAIRLIAASPDGDTERQPWHRGIVVVPQHRNDRRHSSENQAGRSI